MESRLSQFVFTGAHRSRPNQRLPGQLATSSERDAFVEKLRLDREEREVQRKQATAAARLQRCWRRRQCRGVCRRLLRAEFDAEAASALTCDEAAVRRQTSRLIPLFCPADDAKRLLWLCSQCVSLRRGGQPSSEGLATAMRPLYRCCLRFIEAADTQHPFAAALRVLETLALKSESEAAFVASIGYFAVLRRLFVRRVHLPPDDVLEESARMPSPMAEEILRYMFLPILSAAPERRASVLRRYARDVLQPRCDAHTVCCLVPALADAVKYGRVDFETFVDALVDCHWSSALADADQRAAAQLVICSPFLAYSFVRVAHEASIEGFTGTARAKLVYCLALFAPSLRSFMGEPEGDDSGDEMQTDSRPVVASDAYLLQAAVKCLQSSKLAHAVSGAYEECQTTAVVHSVADLYFALSDIAAPSVPSEILFKLSWRRSFLRKLWQLVVRCRSAHGSHKAPRSILESLQRGSSVDEVARTKMIPLLSLFCALFSNTLVTVHDVEFYDNEQSRPASSAVPFSRAEMATVCERMRNLTLGLIDLAFPDDAAVGVHSRQGARHWQHLFDSVVRLLVLLHERDARLQFCHDGFWSAHNRRVIAVSREALRAQSLGPRQMRRRRPFAVVRWLRREDMEEDGAGQQASASDLRNVTILCRVPFLVSFLDRVRILHDLITTDKMAQQRNEVFPMAEAGIVLRVRRNHLYEDAIDKLSARNEPSLKKAVRVQMMNWAGLDEAGIDGGGIFREFLSELLKEAFDPNLGLFTTTPHERLLYPNPAAASIFPDDALQHFYFLGRILGKLIYENQLTELRFASFFLSKLLSKSSDALDIHHLASLDPILYRNLLDLKLYEGGVESLELDFSVMVDRFGTVETIDLKPNGRETRVTNANKLEYVRAVADFYLNRQIRPLVAAFREGFANVVDMEWLAMFDHREIQTIISGADADVDLADMRSNTQYGAAADGATDETVESFWRVVTEFSPLEKRLLLKFVTGCSRPPLMGFKDLYPKFGIQLIAESDRLPSAATCMNLLKLPRFRHDDILREKLLYAISAGSGFELS